MDSLFDLLLLHWAIIILTAIWVVHALKKSIDKAGRR